MKSAAQGLLRWAFEYDPEHAHVSALVSKLARGNSLHILDVGCGYGRYLRGFAASGHKVTGVDMNPEIRASLTREGYTCVGPHEMGGLHRSFDLLLLSHVIAHIRPEVLVETLDACLDQLKPGGHLIVCSPLLSPWFYEDFDIVKPYQPTGFLMVFGGKDAQVQYYSRNKLALAGLWYRRGYFRHQHCSSRYLKTAWSRVVLAADFASAALFRLSGGLIGRKDGWVGVFEKTGGAEG